MDKRPLADRIWRIALVLVVSWLALFIGVIVGFRLWSPHVVNEFKQVLATTSNNTLVFDRGDKLLAAMEGLEDRHTVGIKDISTYLQKAVVALEDRRFFGHRGLDPIRLFGAFWANLRSMAYQQGGSTITQQLVKLTLLTPERTLSRKFKEIFMAVAMEMEFSKLELLEFYLNRVYLGYGLYGVEKASQAYFHKSAADLDLIESAFLAALIKKPEGYLRYPQEQEDAGSPTLPLEKLGKLNSRKNLVLEILGQLGWVPRSEALEALRQELTVYRPSSEVTRAPYFVQQIKKELRQSLGIAQVAGRGYRVYTTLDNGLQAAAEAIVVASVGEGRQASQAAIVVLEPETGYVRALVGGTNFSESQFDRAILAQRQPGSAFKPIMYAAALENGFTPNMMFVDEPVRYIWGADGVERLRGEALAEVAAAEPIPLLEGSEDSAVGGAAGEDVYEPRNYNDQYGALQFLENGQKLREPRMTIARALERSSNVIAVQVLDKLGILPVVRLAGRMGITVRREMGLCIALGCSETTLLDLTAAFSSFANGGLRTRPVFIRKITNKNGDVLYEQIPDPPEEVISPWTAFQMRTMLSAVIASGTGRRARLNRPAGGKTGTNDGPRDAWFIGFTSELVAGVWIGNDDNQEMPNEAGGRTPARMWKQLMQAVPSSGPPLAFPKPEIPYVTVRTCPVSGLVANPYCPWPVNYNYREDEAPARICDIHGQGEVAYRSPEQAVSGDPEYTTTNPYVSRLREAFGEPDPKVNQPSP